MSAPDTAASSVTEVHSPPEAAPGTADERVTTDAPVTETDAVDTAPPSVEANPRATDSRESLGLTRADRVVIATLACAAGLLMLVNFGRLSGWGTQPVEVERQTPLFHEHRLDVNTATWVEWMQLEGIGETLSHRIVADREANGPFESVEDLARVNGIGAKTVEKLRPWIVVKPIPAPEDRPASVP